MLKTSAACVRKWPFIFGSRGTNRRHAGNQATRSLPRHKNEWVTFVFSPRFPRRNSYECRPMTTYGFCCLRFKHLVLPPPPPRLLSKLLCLSLPFALSRCFCSSPRTLENGSQRVLHRTLSGNAGSPQAAELPPTLRPPAHEQHATCKLRGPTTDTLFHVRRRGLGRGAHRWLARPTTPHAITRGVRAWLFQPAVGKILSYF